MTTHKIEVELQVHPRRDDLLTFTLDTRLLEGVTREDTVTISISKRELAAVLDRNGLLLAVKP